MTVRSDSAMLRPFHGNPAFSVIHAAYWIAVNRRERDRDLQTVRLHWYVYDAETRAEYIAAAKRRHRDMMKLTSRLRETVAKLCQP